MVWTNYGCENIKQVGILGSGTPPNWMGIGAGSGTEAITESGLKTEHTSLRKQYDTVTGVTSQQSVSTFSFASNSLSGLTVSEFGMWSDATGGNIWDVHRFGSVAFDGTVELQIQVTTLINPSGT